MASAPHSVAGEPGRESAARPRLVYVYGQTCGQSRKVESFLAQILQRRRNHDTFRLVRVCAEDHPELVARLRIEQLPTIVVIEDGALKARLERPTGRSELEAMLRPWLK